MIPSTAMPVLGGPIVGAGQRSILEQSAVTPNMNDTVQGWARPMVVGVIRNRIEAGEAVPFKFELRGHGILQPAKPEKLDIKAEGERSWKKFMLHCSVSIALETDDVIEVSGRKYRVTTNGNQGDFGFIRYDLEEAFDNA